MDIYCLWGECSSPPSPLAQWPWNEPRPSHMLRGIGGTGTIMNYYNVAGGVGWGGYAIVLHISSDFTKSIMRTATGNHSGWNRCFMLISRAWERNFHPTVHFSPFPLSIPGRDSFSTAVSCKPICSFPAPRSHFINQTQPRTSHNLRAPVPLSLVETPLSQGVTLGQLCWN